MSGGKCSALDCVRGPANALRRNIELDIANIVAFIICRRMQSVVFE